MARILLTWELGAGSGHWANLRPVAEKLAEQGHEVIAALRCVDVVCGQWSKELPITVLQAPFFGIPRSLVRSEIRSFAQILENVGYSSSDSFWAMCSAWDNLYSLVRPSLILFEHSPTALLAARSYDCPKVVLGTGFCSPPNVYPMPDLQPWRQSKQNALLDVEDQVSTRINRVLRQRNTQELSRVAELFYEVEENLLTTFPEIDHYGPRKNHEYLGTWPSDSGVDPCWSSEKKPHKVFAYLRMQYNIEGIFASLMEHDCEVIAYVPDCTNELRSRYSDSSVQILQHPVNLSRLTGNCSFAVLYGGASTLGNCLLMGIPTLNFPRTTEQLLSGYRVSSAGLGLCCGIDQLLDYDQVIEKAIGDEDIKQSSRQFASRYKDYDPVATLNDLCERITRML